MTRQLSQLDLMVVAAYLLMIFIAGMWLTRRAGQSVDEFFVGGLTDLPVEWILIGTTSLVLVYSLASGFYGAVVGT